MKVRIAERVLNLCSSEQPVAVHNAKESRKGLVHRLGTSQDIIERNTSANARIVEKYYKR